MKPIDKATLLDGERGHRAATKVNAQVASKTQNPRGRASCTERAREQHGPPQLD